MEPKQKTKAKSAEYEIDSLRECNRILKEHLDFLRVKLERSEALLKMYIEANDKAVKDPLSNIVFSVN